VFLISWGDLERRYDAQYYAENIGCLDSIRLGKIARVKGGKRIPKGFYYSEEETNFLYLRIENIDDDGYLDYPNFKYISKEVYTILKNYGVKKNDLLIAIVGATIGKISIIDREFNKPVILTENCAKIQIKDESVLPNYLKIVLQTEFLQKQIRLNYIQTTVPKLGLERIEALRIPPIPPLDIQQHLVSLMDNAYTRKHQKETEAAALLASIDGYLLDELGITLPEAKENTIQNRMFKTTFSKVSGCRFDPAFHKSNLSLHSERFKMVRLKDYVKINPRTIFPTDTGVDISFVPMECISGKYGEISYFRRGQISESKGYTSFQENDLLWAKITPCMENGKSAVAKNLLNGFGFGSTEFHVFRAKYSNVNIDFLHALFRTKLIRETAVLHFTGSAGQQRVPACFFEKLVILLPSIEKQTEVANHIQAIRHQAKQLEQEGKDILGRAKTKVEQMIIEGKSWK